MFQGQPRSRVRTFSLSHRALVSDRHIFPKSSCVRGTPQPHWLCSVVPAGTESQPRSVCLKNTVLDYSTAYLSFWQRSVAAEAGELHLQCGLRRCLSLRSPPHLQRSPRRRSHEACRLYGSAKRTCLAEPRQSVRKHLCNGVRTCAYRPKDCSTCMHISLDRSLPVPAFPVKNTFLCSSHTSCSTCFCRTKARGQALCFPDSSMAVGNCVVASG